MSNLLDKASIVLTPTAYDNGKVLCVKPSDGSGDFDFSRNSAATRVNAQGLVENVQILSSNLVQNGDFSQIGSEQITNGNFSQLGSEVVIDGDFSSGAYWGGDSNIAGGQLTKNTNGLAYQQTIPVSVNDYNVVVNVETTAPSLTIYLGGTQQALSQGVNTIYMKSGGSNNFIGFNNGIGSVINSISVKEVGQDWTFNTGWSVSEDKAVSDGTINTSISQSNVFTIGKSYKVTISVNDVVGSLDARFWMGTGGDKISINSQGDYIAYWKADGTDLLVTTLSSNTATYSVTNISVKEVGQNWIIEAAWTIGDGVANGNGANGSNEELAQQSVFIVGKTYTITYEVKNYVSGSVRIRKPDGTTRSANGVYTEILLGTSSGIIFRGGNFNGSITNIIVKEITDDTNIPRINYEGFSYQNALGSEEIVNGDFSNGLANWVVDDGTSWTNVGNTAFCDGNNGLIKQSFTSAQGKVYKVTFDSVANGGGLLGVRVGSGGYDWSLYTTGTHTIYLTAGSFNTQGVMFYATAGWTGSIDNVSVKEVLGQEVVPDSGCGSWLFEPQSTNLITYSEDFSNSYWSKTGASVVSGFISPDGTSNAFKLVEDTSTGLHTVTAPISTAVGTTHTFSAYAKKGERNWIALFTDGDVNYFDINSGTVGTIGAGITAKIELISNGWYRCSVTKTVINAGSTVRVFMADSDNGISYTGNGTSGVYIFGAQLEALSYSTSYIPTDGTTVTRNRDLCTNGGSVSTINSTEGVLYAQMAKLINDGVAAEISLSFNNSNRIEIRYLNVSNQISAIVRAGGNVQAVLSHNVTDITEFHKIAFKYKENDFALWIDGVEVATDTSGTTIAAGTLNECSFTGNGNTSSPFFGKTKCLAVWKEALTDAELTALTTI